MAFLIRQMLLLIITQHLTFIQMEYRLPLEMIFNVLFLRALQRLALGKELQPELMQPLEFLLI